MSRRRSRPVLAESLPNYRRGNLRQRIAGIVKRRNRPGFSCVSDFCAELGAGPERRIRPHETRPHVRPFPGSASPSRVSSPSRPSKRVCTLGQTTNYA